MPNFVEVYSKTTGRKQWVPDHFIDHPVLGGDFEIVPSKRDKELPDGTPDETWKRPQLDAYATALGLDTSWLPNKTAVLAAIDGHQSGLHEAPPVEHDPANPDAGDLADVDTTQTTGDTESSDETPA